MTEKWVVQSFQQSDVGRKRRHNEDYVGCYKPEDPSELAELGKLYVVADGVGGAAAGEEASKYAVEKLLHEYYNVSTEPVIPERLRLAVAAANLGIFEQSASRPDGRPMATTLVAAVIHDDELVVANVGDSRAYLVRGNRIKQITRDHSLVAQLVREGSITAEEAETHPDRNKILRSLGLDDHVSVDIFTLPLLPGDTLVLCSDGLTRHVSDPEIKRAVQTSLPEEAVRRLIHLANVRGGKDNISVSVTSLRPPGAEELPAAPAPSVRVRRSPIAVAIFVFLFLVWAASGLWIARSWWGEGGTPDPTPIPASPKGLLLTSTRTVTPKPTVMPTNTPTLASTPTPTVLPSSTPSPTGTPTPEQGGETASVVETAGATETNLPDNAPSIITYTVRAGDNLLEIARCFGVTLEDIVKENKGKHPDIEKDPDNIQSGLVLTIPSPHPTPGCTPVPWSQKRTYEQMSSSQ